MAEGEPSYIDYEVFLDPEFSPASFANSLVVATNNATDSPLDLSTPLSRVLFDLQEIDIHIHTLTSKSALPLLSYTRDQTAAAGHILQQSEEQIVAVTQGYERLEREVLRKWEMADEARVAAEQSLVTVRLARAVSRCLNLGRQLESQLGEMNGRTGASGSEGVAAGPGREDFRALERAAYTILNLRRMFLATGPGDEGYGLERVKVVRTLRGDLVNPAESLVKSRAQQAVNRFSVSSVSGPQASSGYKQVRDMRTRLTSAIAALYALSPSPKTTISAFEYRPELLLSTLKGYMHSAIGNSLNALTRALAVLPTLERTLTDLSGRCQDIVALEYILGSTKLPSHPLLLPADEEPDDNEKKTSRRSTNVLQPLLSSLDTPSLPSYFWRSLASSLASRVQEILQRGGVSARTLRSSRERLRDDIRECVLRGSQLPTGTGMTEKGRGEGVIGSNWEREAAVMVSSVVGAL